MVAPETLPLTSPTMIFQPSTEHYSGIHRILAAAVVNREFRHLLLHDPEQALRDGFQGEAFVLSDAERLLLLSIHADSLADLASQISSAL
ncbi:MAG: hypothetical protein D6770_11365 [Anaerolineae bacterium]|nr:MAG: hypothetical protein D6770_11365 [Anaerolineae bacterium]